MSRNVIITTPFIKTSNYYILNLKLTVTMIRTQINPTVYLVRTVRVLVRNGKFKII